MVHLNTETVSLFNFFYRFIGKEVYILRLWIILDTVHSDDLNQWTSFCKT